MKFDTVIKAVFAVAALIAAGTYAYNSFVDRADTALADGVDSVDGYDVTVFGTNAQGGFIAVTKYAENPLDPAAGKRHCMTIYQVKRTADGEGEFYLVGSRCLDYDAGPDLIKFEAEKGTSPADLKEAFEKANKNKRR